MIQTLLTWLYRVVEPFRFIERARQRQQEREQAQHERLVDLIDTLFARLEKMEEQRSAAMIAAANAAAAQAEALQTWLEMFKQQSAEPVQPAPTVRPSDEWQEEQEREKQRLIELGYPVDKSPEEQMAWLLSQEFISI